MRTVKKRQAIPAALVILLVLFIPQNLDCRETGFKYFKNYSYKEYDHQAQNWGMVQAENGIIYVANHGGVLEFDGVSWRIIYVPNMIVRSIAIDETGTIYIGGKNELGFLAPDAKGTLKYNSLRQYLPKNQNQFANVWRTYTTKKGVYFQTPQFLFRWDYKQMRVWKPMNRFYFSFMVEGKLFIRQQNVGLVRLDPDDDSLKLVPGGEIFKTRSIYMMVPYHPGSLLIGTETGGFYIYNGGKIIPFPTEVDNYLKKNKLYYGIRLSSGDFALTTRHGGLAVMDRRGSRKYIFDKNTGLQDGIIYYLFEDIQKNLWLCMNKRISKIEYISPISIHDERSNLSGLILSVVRHGKDLYVGTEKGLYYLESPLKFRQIEGMSGSCWSLASIKHSILAATRNGVFQVDHKNNGKRKIVKDTSYVLLQSRHRPGLTWCGTVKGLAALTGENKQRLKERRFKTLNQDIRTIAEDKDGGLWLITSTGGVLKADFTGNIDEPVVTWYETSRGLPGGEVYAATAAGHVMFATTEGIFRFDEKKNRFIPDQTLGNEFAGGPEKKDVFRIAEGKNRHIWFHSQSRNYQAIPGSGGLFEIYSKPFRRLPTAQVNTIYPDPDGKNTWFASFDGLIRYDTTIKKNYRQEFRTLIRKVRVNEKLVFNGNKNKTGRAAGGFFPIIKYKNRNLHFEFAAPFFEVETETQYRCLLEGYDDNWSTWSKDTKRNYTNLDSGTYTFRVQAENIYRHIGIEDVFRFKVLPPWYKTWWAFLLYGTGLFLLIFLAVKWRSANLEQEKQKLERIVEERTKEVHEKNKILENQTHQLKDQSEKLKEMDQVKSRFFANISHEFRTPLTLIMGPLEQMYSNTADNEQKDKYEVMLRNSQRLLTLINQLLDLSRFESGKVKLQARRQNIVPFLKGTMASFQLLAQQNQLELEFQAQEQDISLYFDPRKMEEVMYNLLINAFKFTPARGKITVSLTLEQKDPPQQGNPPPAYVVISVSDTGIGIPKDQLNYIFDRFYQAESLKEKGNKGTGIGLALTKEIVLLHHGKIDVHSQEGKGTEFVIRLPMGRGHLKPAEIAPTPEETAPAPQPAREKKKAIEALMPPRQDTAVEKAEASANNTENQEKSVILVVEDHDDVRKYIRGSLEPLYTVEEARDGKEGIEKAKEIIPDLIVSDIMMPEIDGNELCRQVKSDIRTSHVPVVMLTAKASEDSIIQGLETGADDYITKPFNSKILAARIKNLIELRSHLQQKIQKQMLLQPNEIPISSMDQEFIKELQDLIERNLSDHEFHVEQLSKKLYMNRATLYRKIKALTGETPTEFIRSYRLKRAAQLLRGKFGNVSEVALEVGFNNMAYFAERFKEKFHQLPSTYQASE